MAPKRKAGTKSKSSRSAMLDHLETEMRLKGWSDTLARRVAAETGWSRRTIYRAKDEILDKLAEEDAADLHRQRARFLLDVRRARAKAEDADRFGDVARLLDMEGKVLGMERVPLPEVDADEETDTTFEGVLAHVRHLRRQAEAGHSYVAAEKLLAREVELVQAIEEREARLAAERLEHLSEEEVAQELIEALSQLPESLRAAVLESVETP